MSSELVRENPKPNIFHLDYNQLILFSCPPKYAIWDSAWPFSFLNGIFGKWCKLNFELYGIHKKKLFLIPLPMSLQNHNNSCK